MYKIFPSFRFSETLSKEVISFSIRAVLMLAVWILLDQISTIDLGIMHSMQRQGVFILNKFSHLDYRATQVHLSENSADFSLICKNARLNVGKACDGKSLLFMYLSFIIIYPNIPIKSRLIHGLLGLILIHEFNVIRVVLLSIILKNHPYYFPIMHKYIFQVIMYTLIFFLVKHFLKKQTANEPQ